jgi:4-amino-4-deoxy-L-arabinose transferase-like glycosyltransferase
VKSLRLKLSPDRVLLGIAFLIFSGSTIVWTLHDKTPPPWDPSDHLITAYDYYRPLAHGQVSQFGREFFFGTHYYAPLIHIVGSFFFLIFGASRLSGVAVNIVALGILLASTWWLGNSLYSAGGVGITKSSAGIGPAAPADYRNGNSPRLTAGAIAAVFVACYHFPAWLLHDAFLDYPLMAIVAASFALLIKAGDFHVRRDAVLFGIAAGLGLLAKQTFPFFFILPAVYLVARAMLTRDAKALTNLALAGLIAFAIAAVWYGPHFKDVISIYRANQLAAIDENEAPLFSFMSNVVYLHGLISFQVQAVFGILFIVGLLFSLARWRRQSIMLYLWIASGIGSFTCIANKDLRYTVPILPAVALISVAWIGSDGIEIGLSGLFRRRVSPSQAREVLSGSLANRRFRRLPTTLTMPLKLGASLALLAWSLFSFFNAQWPRDGMGRYIDTPHFRWMVSARNYFGFDHRPMANNWSVPDLVSAIADSNRATNGQLAVLTSPGSSPRQIPLEPGPASSGPPTVGVVVNLPYLNPSSVALYSRLLSRGRAGAPIVTVDWLVSDSARDRISKCDYLVVRTGLDKADWVGPLEKEIQEMIVASPDRFIPVCRFPIPMPDAYVVVYNCKH